MARTSTTLAGGGTLRPQNTAALSLLLHRVEPVLGPNEIWDSLLRAVIGAQKPIISDTLDVVGFINMVDFHTQPATVKLDEVVVEATTASTRVNESLILLNSLEPSTIVDDLRTRLTEAATALAQALAKSIETKTLVEQIPEALTNGGCILIGQWVWAVHELSTIGEAEFRLRMSQRGFTQAEIDDTITKGKEAASSMKVAVKP